MNSLRTVLLLLAFLSGCRLYRTPVPPVNYYYLNPDKDLSAIGRVAIVDLNNDSGYTQISVDVTKLLFQALQKKQVFGLTVVHQSAPAWRSLQLEPDSTYSLEQSAAIRRTLKCDAVLVGTITEYQPYPHIAVGLRLRLVDLRDGQLLWAFEQIWDSADKTTEYRIENYFRSQMSPDFTPLSKKLVTVSPIKFTKFVVYEVAETLQPDKIRR